jgi:hypothetical protein
MKEPIFILANPRSGSSVFRLILNSTDTSIFPPECGFIQWLHPKYKNWNRGMIDDFVIDVLNSKKMEGWKILEYPLNVYLKFHNPITYSEACYLVYKYYGELNGKNVEIWGDKNNYYIHHLDTISEIYPNAKYIWLKRNPMDVCASYLRVNELPDTLEYKPKMPIHIDYIFNEIKENYTKIEDFLTNIEKSNKYVVNFEDILSKNKSILDEISKFVGIDMLDAMDNFDKKLYFDEPNETMAWKGKTKEVLDTSYINTYKSHPKAIEIESNYNKIKW